ncbi:MAG: carboxypeptidase M32 [Velocimicrobium sp.]
MNVLFKQLEENYLQKGQALFTALTLIEWDQATEAPKEADENTSKVVGILSDLYFSAYINDEVKTLMHEICAQMESLDARETSIFHELELLYERLETIPKQEYREYSELTTLSLNVWERAKESENFDVFAPTLEKIVNYKKKFASYRKKDKDTSIYDILLSDFEAGFDEEKLDEFFSLMKRELVPFIQTVTQKTQNVDKSFNYKYFDKDKQKEFCTFLANYIGFDFTKGVIKESAHPFTTNFHNKDVRITNHYYENNLESAIFSIIHEGGHAIYEMQVADEFTQTLVGEGTSMGMHESQSRFYENIIGRSESFWKPIYQKLVELFEEQLGNVSLEQFILAINKPERGFIRTEADELTYTLHVLIRYEIEKLLFEDKITVNEIPQIWNEKYKEYLGITPKNDKEGCLQDVHWACGDFGYFPSYALGSAIGAQIYYYMKTQIPVDTYLAQGNLIPIKEFLKERIHKFGKTKNTDQILMNMTGEAFNPNYYVNYLKEKYERLYGA